MLEITYTGVFIFITLAWIITRIICGIKSKKADWKFEVEDAEFENNNLVFEWDNNLMAVALVPVPVPNGEAEHFAAGNYTWKEGVETTKKHSAQLIIFAMKRMLCLNLN